jgi:hypothetical protein
MVSSDFSDVLAKTANRKQNEREHEHELASISSIDSKTQMMMYFFWQGGCCRRRATKKAICQYPQTETKNHGCIVDEVTF